MQSLLQSALLQSYGICFHFASYIRTCSNREEFNYLKESSDSFGIKRFLFAEIDRAAVDGRGDESKVVWFLEKKIEYWRSSLWLVLNYYEEKFHVRSHEKSVICCSESLWEIWFKIICFKDANRDHFWGKILNLEANFITWRGLQQKTENFIQRRWRRDKERAKFTQKSFKWS